MFSLIWCLLHRFVEFTVGIYLHHWVLQNVGCRYGDSSCLSCIVKGLSCVWIHQGIEMQNDDLYLSTPWCFVSLCTEWTWRFYSISVAVTVHEVYCAFGSLFQTDSSFGRQMNVGMVLLFPAVNRVCFAVQFLTRRSNENHHIIYIVPSFLT
jgi:hypothetical protein